MISLIGMYVGLTFSTNTLKTPNIEPQSIVATVTAYTDYETCDNCITASGIKPFVGVVACPRSIPFHTQIEILGQIFFCEDRTALRFGDRYDIFFGYGKEAYDRAIQFGKRKLNIKIL